MCVGVGVCGGNESVNREWFTIHYSLFTIHHSLFTTHYSQFTIHPSDPVLLQTAVGFIGNGIFDALGHQQITDDFVELARHFLLP